MKKTLALLLLVPVSLILAGCVKTNGNRQNLKNPEQINRGQNGQGFNKMFENLNLQKIALADLKLNDKVTVFGPINSDGSVNAEKLILGDLIETMKTAKHDNPEVLLPQEKQKNEKENFPPRDQNDFERKEFTGQKGAGKGMMLGRAQNLVGEILKIEEQTITIKLPDGGSKIILLNDKTEISNFDPQNLFKETAPVEEITVNPTEPEKQ
ncbi:MAG: hypothetical protein WCT18_02855 [Patescibacteria group bacterium]